VGQEPEELRDYYSDTAPVSAVKFKIPKRIDLPVMPGARRSMIGDLRDFLGTVRNPINSEIQETLGTPPADTGLQC
jgi:hypothetical protein